MTATTLTSAEAKTLPPARRVFTVDLDRDGSDELLIAHQTTLSAHRWLGSQGGWQPIWEIKGPGVAQTVLPDPVKPELYIAWGMGKGQMVAPITLGKVDALSGTHRVVWTYQGGRSQTVELAWVQDTTDQTPSLMVVHFVSKYHTRRVLLDQLDAAKIRERSTGQIRMGTSWLVANIDGKPGLEEVVGRVYGDVKGEYGDLWVYPFKSDTTTFTQGEVIATQRGVKTLLREEFTTPASGAEGTSVGVFFSDGWVAAYGKKAKASLKRLSWQQGRPIVEQLATSPDEFTFFSLWSKSVPSGKRYLFAYGNKGISLITPEKVGPWRVTRLLDSPPIVNAAIGYTALDKQWWGFTPHESGAKAHPLTLPQ